MLTGRIASGTTGKTRACPHCKTTILESAVICPQCRHHLKFGGPARPEDAAAKFSALSVEGTLRHSERGSDWEYSVVVSIRNERGEEVGRQVVGLRQQHQPELGAIEQRSHARLHGAPSAGCTWCRRTWCRVYTRALRHPSTPT